MFDNTKKYSFTLPDGRSGVWTEEQMQKGREALYKKYPDAQVMSLTEYNAAQGIDDDAMFVIDTGDGRTSTWDSAQMMQGYDALMAKYPHTKVMRAKQDTYWQDKAAEQTAALNKFDADNDEFFRQHEKDTALYNTGESSRINFDEEGYLERDRQYRDLQSQRQQMEIERANNPYIKAMYESQSRKSDEDIARYDEQIAALKSSDNKDRADLRNLRQARKLARDTKDVYDVDVANSNDGFAEYVRNMGQGAGDVFGDADFWSRGLTSIARNINIHSIEKRLNKDGRSLYDLTEEEIDKELTPTEKDLFIEFIRNASAQAERAGNMARGYTAGQSAAESVGFMAEFIVTAGIAKGIGTALDAAESGLGKWIARELTGKTAEAITSTAGKVAYNAIARPVEKAIFHTALHPTTYSSIAEALTQIDDNGQLVKAGNAIASTILDQFIENWSESIGEPIEKILPPALIAKGAVSETGQKILSKIGKADWAKMWVDSDVHRVLIDAGFNGLIGEMAEEWAGNAVRLSTGLMDKDEFAKFASWDEQVDMMASFAPMSLFGLGSQSVAAHRLAKERNANLALVRDALTRQGWTEQEIHNVLDTAHTKAEIKEMLRPVVNNIVSQRTNGGNVTTDYLAMLDFARINEMGEILDEARKYEREQSRASMRQAIEMGLGATDANPDSGRFSYMVPSVNEDGTTSEQEMVTTITDDAGNIWYLIGQDNAKVILRKKGDTSGQPFFITIDEYDERLADGSYKEYTTTVDEYLDSEVEAQRKAQESRRINDAVTTQYEALNKRMMQNPEINLGTDEAPKIGIILDVRRDGVIIEFETPIDLGVGPKLIHKISLDRALNALGESSIADTRTDDQIAIDEANREYVQEQRLKQLNKMYRSSSVNVNGEQLTVERVSDLPYNTEDGNEVIKVAARNASGEINEIVVPVSDIQVNEQISEVDNTDVTVDTNLDFRGNPLPMTTTEDGITQVVDETALWNRDPEAYLRWNDARRNGVTDNSERYLGANIANLTKQMQALDKAQAEDLDPQVWQSNEDKKAALANKINLYQSLLNKYQVERQTKEALAQIQQQTSDMYRKLLMAQTPEQTAEINAKIDALREQYYATIAQGLEGQAFAERKVNILNWVKGYADMPVKTVDLGDVIGIIREDGATESQIEECQAMVNKIFAARRSGKYYVINGFHLNGTIYLFAEGCINEDVTKATFYHEREHEITERDPLILQPVIDAFGGDYKQTESAVEAISGTTVYNGSKIEVLADELVAFSIERLYLGRDAARELLDIGIPEEFINYIIDLYGKQTTDGYRLPTKQNGSQYVGRHSVTGGEPDGTVEAGTSGDGRLDTPTNGGSTDRERIGSEVTSLFENAPGETPIQGLENYTRDELKSIVREYVSSILSENGIESELVDVELHGSRGRGTARKDSDLDAVVEYRGDIREDGMFNLLNAEDSRLVIDGITVDVNPIRAEETGTMASYMERSRRYDAEMTGQPAFRTVAITPEVRNEMDEIIDKAKADGTYLKAPNGRDTRLSPEQWAMVRTEQFKKWFGDWELAAKILNIVTVGQSHGFKNFDEAKKWAKENIVRILTNEETGGKGEIRISNNAISKFLSESAISKSDSKDVHLSVLKVLPDVIRESIDVEQHSDYKKGEDGIRSIENGANKDVMIHRLYGAVSIDGKLYRTKITVKEYKDKNRPQSAYSYEATKIELFAGTLVGANSSNPSTNNSISAANLLNGIEKSYSPGEKLINSSKVVDENGEPMVVYHGLKGNDFNVFDKDIAAENSRSSQPVYGAFFFSDNKDNASAYGTKSDNGVRSLNGLKEVFLKADNPFVVDANGEQYHSVKAYFKERDTGEINWERGGIVMDGNEVGVQDITIAARDLGYDSVIFKNIDDPGSEDFVGKPQTTIAVFSPTQIKSATDNTGAYSNNNPNVRFRAVPVEGNKNLVAIHNLKEQDLRNAFELGGFPMPSIAITKAEVGHTDFGDISLIFDKNSIDPRNRKNKVYGGDAWTPMFPKIAYKLNYDKTRDIYRRAVNVGELPMFNSSNFNNVNYEDSIDDTGESGLINSFKDDYGAKQFFLAEQGNPVLAYETKEADKYDARTVGRINELLNTIGLENLKKQDYLNVSPEVIDLLRTWFDKLDDKMLNRVGRNYVQKAIDYAENGNKKTEVDYEATRRKIDERVDTIAFEKWLEDMFSGIVDKRGIRNEVDLYTPSGNRRPFEKLYDDITLDNVVKAMSRAPEKGGSGFFHGNIFGAASGTFGSLTQIREAAKQRIESIEPSEIEKDKKAIIDRLSNVKVTDKELDISEMFDLTSNIQDAVAKTHTPEGIYKYLKEFYPDTTLEAAQEISDIVKDIQQLSTRYFEAKPYRAVGFDEVKLAVVPEGTSQDIFDGLRERGVDVRTYTDGDQEQRKQVVADTAKETGLNFRINADERKYANENIDKAIAFVRGISVKEASDMRKDDERRIKEKTTELYSKVLDNQFDDITLQLIDEFIANVTPNNPYRQPLSKRLPPSVGRRMRGVERNNAVDGLFTRIAESTVREAGSSVERTRARREAEEKKKELLKGWAIATGNWHTSVSDFTDNTEPIGKGKDSVVYNSNDGNNVIKVSFGKNKEKKFSPDIDAVNLFNAVFPNTRYEILGYGEIDGKFVKFLKQPSVRFSENPTVSVEDRIDYMRNLGFEPINKEKSAFSNGELVVADVQKGNIVRDVNGKIRVIDADVKLHTKDIGGNYTYPPASDDILPQSGGISFRTANENQQVFISNTLASLDKIPMKSGNAQAWINRIQQAGGLKKEEDKWIGLTDWLKEQDGNISKEDVAEYIREHQVKIEDVNYGESVVFVKDRLAKKYGDIVNEAFQIDEEYGEENIYVKDLDKAIEFYNSQNTITPILDSLYMDEDGKVDQREMEDTLIEWMSGIASEVASENENKEIDPIRLQYTTGGLVKNREIALVVPDIQPYNKTDLVHFGNAGDGRAIAWARFGDAKDADGNKVLVIDEIQSKRHQDAKEKGYQENFDANIYHLEKKWEEAVSKSDGYYAELLNKVGSEEIAKSTLEDETYQKLLEDTRNAFLELDEALSKKPYSNRVPDAPFRDSWDALAMKRMLRLAAEEGYDKLAWTNGKMQSDRYNLTKVLEDFYYKPNGDGTYKISAALKQRRNGYEDYSDINYDSLTAERIGEIFGKEIAEKVSTGKGRNGYSHNNEGDWVTFKGRDLKVSNEGMRYFYDQKLVNWMNKYSKKWGVQVEDLTLHGLENKEGWHSVDITPEMKESVMEGQVMFSVTDNNLSGFKIAKSDIGAVLNRMEEAAIIPETVPYDITEWNKRLAGKIPTQVGELIMGAHQFVKLDPKFNEQHQDRRGWIGMIDATIHNPLMIVTQDEAGNYQRQFKLVFAKTFKNKEKDDAVFFVSISVLKDTHEAVITSHIRPKKEFGKILENGVVVFSSISMNGIQTEDVQPQLSGTTTPSNKQVGATSKDTNSLDKNNSSDTNFRVTPAQDAEYLAAVEAGDMEKARQMVKEAFLASYPYTEVLDSNGNPKEVLHGTPNKFTVFDKDKIGSNTDAGWLGTGFYFFGNNPEYASQYAKGGRVISAYLDIQNPYLASSSEMNRLADANSREESDAFRKMLEDEGYDGVFYNEDLNEEWVAFEPSQIKSAEPVTYDDNGNVIPLSERFNRGKEDLRFRITPEETPKDTSMEPDVAFASLPIGYAEIQNRLKNEGLAEVGDEDVSDIMMSIFSNSDESVRNDIINAAPRFDYSLSKATGDYFSGLALKESLSDSEIAAVGKMRDIMRNSIGMDNLSAADALWMMYRTMNPISNDVFDIAKDTEVAARLGHSAQGIQARRQAEDAVRMSVTEAMHSQSAAEMYNQAVAYWKNRLKEGYVDMFESVNDLMASMEKATGVKAEEFEDIRIALNQQSSKALNRMKKYTSDYLEPLWQAIADVVSTANFHMDEVVRYVELKHALERNVVFAKRDAIAYHTEEHDSLVKPLKEELKDLKKQLKDAIKNGDVNEQTRINDRINTVNADIADYDNDLARKLNKVDNGTDTKYLEFREKDYAGLTGMFSEYPGLLPRNQYKTDEEYNKAARKLRQPKFDNLRDMENEAQFEIDVFENAIGKDQVDNLWQKINAATKETLRSQYASGLLSKSQYESVSKMFKYYVPLRGFKDDVAEDIWSYYSSAPVGSFSVPIITAKGRTSEADNPFLWIGTMASSAIAQNVKNESKLALYYYAMNNPGQDLVKVQDMWYELDAAETARQGHKVFVAAYPPLTAGMAPTDAVNAYNTWEESMRQKASIGQAYTRHGKFSTNGEVAFIDDKKKAEHFIRLKANGRDVLMFINGSPRAAQAVNGLLNVENTKDVLISRWLLRLMSSFNTSWNPEFWISNMQRDLIFSIMSMDIKGDGMSNFRRNLITPVRMMRLAKAYENGTLDSLEGKDKKYANYYREFADGGAITGYTVVKGNEMWEKEIDRWMKSNGVNYTGKGKDSLRGVKNVVGKFFGKFNELGEAVEQISRFSAFVSAREAGKSIANAVSDAKELTVNFNRKGSGNAIEWSELDQLTKADGTRLNMAEKAVVYAASLIPAYGRRFVMFFNAAIQGLNTMYNLWKTDKRKTTKWMSGYFAMGALQALIHAMLDDDDDYLNIPEYTRRANAMIGAGGIYFKWALPQEARLFYATGDILVQRALGNEKERGALPNISQGALDIINQALDLSPINPADGITDILPSIAQPFVENIINKDFTGANVYYENKYLTEDERARTPKFTNTKRGTSGWAINAAKLINYISGGDKDDAGALNWHPESIQNIIEGIGGGTLTTIGKIGDTVTGLAGQGDLTVRRTLFLNRLFEFEGERNQQYHTNELYRYYKGEAEHTKTKLKKYKKAGDFGEQADLMGSEDYEIYLIFERYQKMLEPYEEQLKIEESSEEKRILNREMDALKREMIHEISNL